MKNKEWTCYKNKGEREGNLEMECFSKRDKAISLWKDGTVRFTKFSSSEVKINGKKTKSYGVELD